VAPRERGEELSDIPKSTPLNLEPSVSLLLHSPWGPALPEVLISLTGPGRNEVERKITQAMTPAEPSPTLSSPSLHTLSSLPELPSLHWLQENQEIPRTPGKDREGGKLRNHERGWSSGRTKEVQEAPCRQQWG
jgi:hypothetical protein